MREVGQRERGRGREESEHTFAYVCVTLEYPLHEYVTCLSEDLQLILFLAPSSSSSSIHLHRPPSSFIQVANMFFTGLLGGAMYVNVFANLVDDPTIANKDRELGINIVALFVNAVRPNHY